MTCREIAEFLMEYVGERDTLSVEVRTHFEQHIDGCGNCQTYLVQYRETIIAGQLACDDCLPDMPEELVQAVLESLARER